MWDWLPLFAISEQSVWCNYRVIWESLNT